MKKIFLSLSLLITFAFASKAQMIPCSEASLFVGRQVTICGQVKSAMHDTLGHKAGMLLGLCVAYPYQPVMVIIKDETLPLYPYTTTTWLHKQICVTGLISTLKGRPYIEVRKRTQVVID